MDGWHAVQDRQAILGPLGLWTVTFSGPELVPHGQMNFTRRYDDAWEGLDHLLQIS
jgi:hypothetical protein